MNQQHLPLAQHFGYGRLLRYTFPAIVMMVITSVYTVVDGFFVSNFVGKISFAAVNFVFPVIMILGSVGFMFGTGGGALIAKTLGEGNHERANRLFSLVVFAALTFDDTWLLMISHRWASPSPSRNFAMSCFFLGFKLIL